MIPSMNNINPWIGLNSYQEGQILYGRSQEIQDLSMSVFYNRQTVVYGKSGIGKSSLLHAGIFPMARLRGCLPISVRFDHASEISYRQQLIQCITDAVLAAGGVMRDTQIDPDAPQSLWEFFHRMQPQKDGQIITPLVVIDQFEEIFTLTKNAQVVRAFFDELADLFNDMMPDYLQSHGTLQKVKETGSIFDGLQIKPSDSRFASEMSYHIVFVLREDYLSYLERYTAHIPTLKQNRYGLLPITYRQAMEIITKPCEGLVSTEVADAIIRHITPDQDINDETPIDSAILSLFLSRLYEKKKDDSFISMQLVKEQGETLIEDFYAEVVATINRKTVELLEDVLINTDGHRENVTIESLYKTEGIEPSSIEAMERAHLLRIFSYGNVQRVEFAHDVLCPIIVRRRGERQSIARMRRTQRNGILVMMASFVILFSLLYVVIERIDSKESLARQQARLNEMEVSLIEKGAQKMLDKHDIYGAIQLLINSIDTQELIPSTSTVRLEKILRQSVDNLLQSKSNQVASIHRKMLLDGQCVISRSERLCGALDETRMGVVIIDTQTGAIVQVFSLNESYGTNNLFGYDTRDEYYFGRNDYYEYVDTEKCTVHFAEQTSIELFVTDIHPNDSRCLLVANDTVLLDCFIYTGDDKYLVSSGEFGATRMCIHDIHSNIIEAAYTTSGDSIAILLADSTILLYDALIGTRLHNDVASSQSLIEANQRKHNVYDEEPNDDGGVYPAVIELTKNTRMSHQLFGEYIISLSTNKETVFRNRITPNTTWSIYHPDDKIVKHMREYLDSLQLSPELKRLQRTYHYSEGQSFLGNRYICPMAINTNQNRVAVLLPTRKTNQFDLYGLYPHNGAIFYHTTIPYEIQTIHFSEDDQYLVVNYGEETQEVIYLPPLEQLVDSCKNMFFDWQMTEEERYQTYIHMND